MWWFSSRMTSQNISSSLHNRRWVIQEDDEFVFSGICLVMQLEFMGLCNAAEWVVVLGWVFFYRKRVLEKEQQAYRWLYFVIWEAYTKDMDILILKPFRRCCVSRLVCAYTLVCGWIKWWEGHCIQFSNYSISRSELASFPIQPLKLYIRYL